MEQKDKDKIEKRIQNSSIPFSEYGIKWFHILKYDNRVSFTFQLEAETLKHLRREAKRRKMSLSDLLNERLKKKHGLET